VQLVVDDVKKAEDALEDAGFSYSEQDVLHIEVPNKPGALGEIARKLAAKNINITCSNDREGLQEGQRGSRSLRLGRSGSPSLGDPRLRGGGALCRILLPEELDVAPNFVTRSIPLGGYCYGHASRA
jgi:hypothetical protein